MNDQPSPVAPPPASAVAYWVWFDLACEDFLAVEEDRFSAVLRQALERDGIRPVRVEANDRRAAVAQAFPKGRVEGRTVHAAVPGTGFRRGRPH